MSSIFRRNDWDGKQWIQADESATHQAEVTPKVIIECCYGVPRRRPYRKPRLPLFTRLDAALAGLSWQSRTRQPTLSLILWRCTLLVAFHRPQAAIEPTGDESDAGDIVINNANGRLYDFDRRLPATLHSCADVAAMARVGARRTDAGSTNLHWDSFQFRSEKRNRNMSPQVVIAGFAIVAATALMTNAATAGRGNVPSPGTWRWPPYAEGGNMPKTTCGYVRAYPYNPRAKGHWIYQCR
jgi:hypothetical protein